MLGMETGAADCGPDSATATRTAPSGVQALLSFVSWLFPPFIHICYHLWSWAGSTLLEQILLAWVARCLHWTLMVLSTAGQVLRIDDWQSMCKRHQNIRKLSNNKTTNIKYIICKLISTVMSMSLEHYCSVVTL